MDEHANRKNHSLARLSLHMHQTGILGTITAYAKQYDAVAGSRFYVSAACDEQQADGVSRKNKKYVKISRMRAWQRRSHALG